MKTKAKSTTARLTVYPSISKQTIKAEFIKALGEPDEASNSHLREFLVAAERTLETARSFTIHDVINNAKTYDIPTEEIKYYFELWTEKLTQFGKLEAIQGCYDDTTFIQCNL